MPNEIPTTRSTVRPSPRSRLIGDALEWLCRCVEAVEITSTAWKDAWSTAANGEQPGSSVVSGEQAERVCARQGPKSPEVSLVERGDVDRVELLRESHE